MVEDCSANLQASGTTVLISMWAYSPEGGTYHCITRSP